MYLLIYYRAKIDVSDWIAFEWMYLESLQMLKFNWFAESLHIHWFISRNIQRWAKIWIWTLNMHVCVWVLLINYKQRWLFVSSQCCAVVSVQNAIHNSQIPLYCCYIFMPARGMTLFCLKNLTSSDIIELFERNHQMLYNNASLYLITCCIATSTECF